MIMDSEEYGDGLEERFLELLRRGHAKLAAVVLAELPGLSKHAVDELAFLMSMPESAEASDKFFSPFGLVSVRWPVRHRPKKDADQVATAQGYVRRIAYEMKQGKTKKQAIAIVASSANTPSGTLHERTIRKYCQKYKNLLPE